MTLPVNPKKVVRVVFPAYSVLLDDARGLLERSPHVLNFDGLKGEALYNALDDLRKAGFLNLVAKANRTRFTTQASAPSVLSFIEELTELRGDRFFAAIPAELRSETINNGNGTLFHEVSELLTTRRRGLRARGASRRSICMATCNSRFSRARMDSSPSIWISMTRRGSTTCFKWWGTFSGGRRIRTTSTRF